MNERTRVVLVVDDDSFNRVLLSQILKREGYLVRSADGGARALEMLDAEPVDIVLLDLLMPGMDGFAVCRRLRANPATYALPVIIITAEGNEEKLAALEAGADDFILKPFDRGELLARVRSLLRIKRYHETIQAQAAELRELNATLESRVHEQVEELDRLGRLRRFLSPQVTEIVVSSGNDAMLAPHRREIAVYFCDLRGFTAFSESAEPEDLMGVVGAFHEALGDAMRRSEATIGYFAGDAVMAYFNDPVPCPEPEAQAVRMAEAIRSSMQEPLSRWRRLGLDLDIGMGIASGYATLGMVGFEGRFEYTAMGSAVNLASRLCAQAKGGQILLSQRVRAATEGIAEAEHVGDLVLKGLRRPAPAYNLVGLRSGPAGS